MFAVVLATTKDWNSNLHKLLLEEKKTQHDKQQWW